MKFEIEQYKNQTIEYDDELDKFVCDITIEDRTKSPKRASLKDLRKEIDAFVKMNLDFKPFKLFKKSSYGTDIVVMNVDGIRTDGKFTCTYPDSPQRGYDIVDFEREKRGGDEFYYHDHEIIKTKKEIDKEQKEYELIIRNKIKELYKGLKKFNATEVSHFKKAFKKNNNGGYIKGFSAADLL